MRFVLDAHWVLDVGKKVEFIVTGDFVFVIETDGVNALALTLKPFLHV